MYFLILIIGSILQCLFDIFYINRISKREAKKACYNCDKCKNWKCFYFYCKEKRNEIYFLKESYKLSFIFSSSSCKL